MMKLKDIDGKRYVLLGYGSSARAAAAFLKANGAHALVWDDHDSARHAARAAGETLFDPETANWNKTDGLVIAPSVALAHPLVKQARKAGVPLVNDLHFLFRASPEARYVGVTGTNGKSTTTALIAHILKDSGRPVQMGGNIGIPALSLNPMGKDDFCVLELSSYQLEILDEHPVSIAALLNITPDHLAHHGSMAAYCAAKAKIVQSEKPQTLAIGTDEPETFDLCTDLSARKNLSVVEIAGKHAAKAGGISLRPPKLHIHDPEPKTIDLSLCPALVGLHNAQNAAAAYACCRAAGISHGEIEKALRSFPGLAHRQQLVATLRGVKFINDSKATNASATEKALAAHDSVYWIVGGQPKETGLAGLEPFLAAVRHAFLIGEAEGAFAGWCEGKISFTRCGTLEKAVEKAAAMAWADGLKNATVLLSPACASFDQYKNFEERGAHFIRLVHELTARES